MEGPFHRSLKKWVVDKYLSEGVQKSLITEEERFLSKTIKFVWTLADVYIDIDGGIAVYCQTHNNYPWLYDFIEKRLPILKEYTKKQIVVFPQNVEMLFPIRFKYYTKELKKHDVDILITPFNIDVPNKSQVRIDLTYKALQRLCDLKNKHSPKKTLIEFIESDLNKLCRRKP